MSAQPIPGQAAQHIPARALSTALGAEVSGLDVRETLQTPGGTDAVIDAVCRHCVLVFRDQRLSAADFVAIGRALGEIELHVLDQYRMPGTPEVYVISNIVVDGKPIGNPREGFGWHTDQSYLPRPTAYTLLYGVETPGEGSDTVFCNTYSALDALEAAERSRLDGLRGIHSFAFMRTGNTEYVKHNASVARPDQMARVPDVVHPLVRTHPLTGRKSLYLGGDCLAGFEGKEESESRPLIRRLFEHATRPDFVYAHKWRPGDLVIWDNRGTMHSATDYDRQRFRRHIWRTSVRGEMPA